MSPDPEALTPRSKPETAAVERAPALTIRSALAWSFQANACELKAIVPSVCSARRHLGVALRAPALDARRLRTARQPRPSSPHDEDEPATIVTEATRHQDVALALLGGPEGGDELRGGLGN